MRMIEQSLFLEIAHRVPNGGRRYPKTKLAGDRIGSRRLRRLDIGLNNGLENPSLSLCKHRKRHDANLLLFSKTCQRGSEGVESQPALVRKPNPVAVDTCPPFTAPASSRFPIRFRDDESAV